MPLLLFVALWAAPVPPVDWTLVWSDEFDGPLMSPPSPARWVYDLGAGGWGNQELETYTNSTDNVFQDGNGNLVIRAQGNASTGYTSARIKTQGKFTLTFGRVDARIKIPQGQGLWPAFWMLGADITTAGWPNCGEIDIMENIGKEPSIVHGTIHGPGYSGGNGITSQYALPDGKKLADDFHIFSAVWTNESVEFLIDGQSYKKITSDVLPAGTQWVFNKPFFIIMNVAVGGGWPGNPDTTTVFPQTMTIDYVRVFSREPGHIR